MAREEKYLHEELERYSRSDFYPFHMPGHKRRDLRACEEAGKNASPSDGDEAAGAKECLRKAFTIDAAEHTLDACPAAARAEDLPKAGPESIDITEIAGFDNLHSPKGLIKTAQERAAGAFGADESFFLVNGSTSGIIAAICAAAGRRGHIIAARNCHRCVYHAIYLMELRAEYVYPLPTGYGIQGSIDPADVQSLFDEYDDISAVVITSPTYDGVVSDIEAIAAICHAHGAALIVDEAHGAHFGFSDAFPKKATAYGADYCIESVHKTLPAYTQSALLHVMDNGFANIKRLKKQLKIFQSTSPSYILMSGIDRCTHILETEGKELFDAFERRLDLFYEKAKGLKNISVIPKDAKDPGIYGRDISKILITAKGAGVSGTVLKARLREDFHLEMEMSSLTYVTALTSIMDTDEGFKRLLDALFATDPSLCIHDRPGAPSYDEIYTPCERAMETAKAMDAESIMVPLDEAEGLISADLICPYPPGIPLLVPGEVIDKEKTDVILRFIEDGIEVTGITCRGRAFISAVMPEQSGCRCREDDAGPEI